MRTSFHILDFSAWSFRCYQANFEHFATLQSEAVCSLNFCYLLWETSVAIIIILFICLRKEDLTFEACCI